MLLSPAFVRVLFDIPLLLQVYVGGICVRLGVCACGWFECVWPLKGRCSRNLLKVNPHVFVYTMSVCVCSLHYPTIVRRSSTVYVIPC